MATIPTPYDATAGNKLTAAAFDAGVRDALKFLLTDYPRCHVYMTTATACPNATDTLLMWDSEGFDNDSMHTTPLNQINITTAGLYHFDIQIDMPSATYTQLLLTVNVSDGGAIGGGTRLRQKGYQNTATLPVTITFEFDRFFNAGDYVDVWITQTSGASRTPASTALATRVFAKWIATA